MARKGKYDSWLTKEGLQQVEGWARDGLNDEQIAKNIGIRASTFYDWMSKFPEFSEAVKKGKAPVDIEVENAMLKTALGHYVKVKKPMKMRTEKRLKKKDKDGREYETGTIVEEHIEYVDEEIYVPPNTAAQIFWLKNRKPGVWRDKPEPPMSSEALDRLDEVLSTIKGVV